jgi:hypothetical protein
MDFSNLDNNTWNENHQGKRVPHNDSGVDGAPFALGSADPTWASGSVNSAVYNTYIQNNPIPAEDLTAAESGSMDFYTASKYVNKEMLWGFSSDSRNKLPGDLIAYRAYPTPILSHDLILVTPYTTNALAIDGTSLPTAGEFTIIAHKLILQYKLPYDVIYRATILVQGVEVYVNYEYIVHAGSLTTSGWRDASNDGDEFIPITTFQSLAPYVVYSIDTGSYTGDLTCTAIVTSVVQSPYYGTFSLDTVVIIQADYRPAAPGEVSMLIASLLLFPSFSLLEYQERIAACTEIVTNVDFVITDVVTYGLFTPAGIMEIGKTIYLNTTGTTLATTVLTPKVPYMYVIGPIRGTSPSQAYLIHQYFILDTNSVVVYHDIPPIGYLGSNCAGPL